MDIKIEFGGAKNEPTTKILFYEKNDTHRSAFHGVACRIFTRLDRLWRRNEI